MGTIVETIFMVGEKLFGLRGELIKAEQMRKQQVAEYLAKIAQTIEEASSLLKQGQYPHGKCQELFVHAQNMEAAIGDLVGKVRALELADQLREVHNIERLHAEFSTLDNPQRERSLAALDQAAGHLRATAAFVRVSP